MNCTPKCKKAKTTQFLEENRREIFFFFKLFILAVLGLSCGSWDLCYNMHVLCSSLNRDQTQAPYIGRTSLGNCKGKNLLMLS